MTFKLQTFELPIFKLRHISTFPPAGWINKRAVELTFDFRHLPLQLVSDRLARNTFSKQRQHGLACSNFAACYGDVGDLGQAIPPTCCKNR